MLEAISYYILNNDDRFFLYVVKQLLKQYPLNWKCESNKNFYFKDNEYLIHVTVNNVVLYHNDNPICELKQNLDKINEKIESYNPPYDPIEFIKNEEPLETIISNIELTNGIVCELFIKILQFHQLQFHRTTIGDYEYTVGNTKFIINENQISIGDKCLCYKNKRLTDEYKKLNFIQNYIPKSRKPLNFHNTSYSIYHLNNEIEWEYYDEYSTLSEAIKNHKNLTLITKSNKCNAIEEIVILINTQLKGGYFIYALQKNGQVTGMEIENLDPNEQYTKL